jgi:predicted PurR-regulated permease PerM
MSAQGEPAIVPRWLQVTSALSWRVLVVAGALVVVGAAFTKLELVIVPVIGALFVSTILVPPARWLRHHGWPPLAATWAVFLGGFVIVAGVIVGLVPIVTGQASALGHDLQSAITRTENWLTGSPLHLSRVQIDQAVHGVRANFTANRTKLLRGALSGASVVLQGVGALLLTVVLTFFFVKDGGEIGEWMASLFDERRSAELSEVGARAWAVLGGYVRGTAINGFVNAVVLAIGLLVLGVPLVVPVALLTFVGGFLPLVGGIVSGVVAVLVALAAKGPVAALVMVGLTVVIHHLEGYLVGPFVLGRAVKLHPVAVLLALTVGTIIGGIVGAFLAVPVASTALAINEYYRERRRHRGPLVLALDEPPAANLDVVRSTSP